MSTLLERKIAEGEHQQQDFKHTIDDSKKIARTLVAFANTDGGTLWIGVKDNGKIKGVDPEEELYMIEAAADMYAKPKVEFQHQVHIHGNRKILEVAVPPSSQKPHRGKDDNGKWVTYLRQKDETILANRVIYFAWKELEKKKGKPVAYTDKQSSVLKTLRESDGCTLSKLKKTTRISFFQLEKILALFLVWEVVVWSWEDGTYYYALKK